MSAPKEDLDPKMVAFGLFIMAAGVWLAWNILAWLFGDQCDRQLRHLENLRQQDARQSTIDYQIRQVNKACSRK